MPLADSEGGRPPNKLWQGPVIALFFLLVLSPVAYGAAAQTGFTFSKIQNLSNDSGASTAPVVQTVYYLGHQYVYVAWEDTSSGSRRTYFRVSSDGGNTWSSTTIFSGLSGKANAQTSAVQMSSNGAYVFLTWMQGSTTAFAASSNNGASFSCGASHAKACILSSGAPAGTMTAQAVASSGKHVYVSWSDSATNGSQYIFLVASSNAGASFSSIVKLNTIQSYTHGEDEIAAIGSYVYATWDSVYFTASSDYGHSWSTPIQLRPSTCVYPCAGREPMVSATGSDVYVTFPMGGLGGTSTYSTIVNVSHDHGLTWTQTDLSKGIISNTREVQVTSDGSNVYVTSRGNQTGGTQQYAYVSNDEGVTWSKPILLGQLTSGTENGFGGFALDNTSGAVYIQWPHGKVSQLYLSESINNGLNWSSPQQVSSSTGGVVAMGDPKGGQGPMSAADHGQLYLVWEDKSTGGGDIYFTSAPSL